LRDSTTLVGSWLDTLENQQDLQNRLVTSVFRSSLEHLTVNIFCAS
jgi:hypothetical protein